MEKIVALFLICLIGFASQTTIVIAQPPEVDENLSIIYPPISPPNRYENNSVLLEVNVRLLEGSPRPVNFSFSLDGSPQAEFEDISTSTITYWMPHVYTLYKAKFSLENLSEGNHTVVAYANDMVVSRTFRVNSFYHPTVVKILSPTNQTYSSSVPLVFTVNLPINGAFYYMYRGYEEVFETHFNNNITLSNLKDGNYVLHLYVTTENGVDSASTYFSVIKTGGIVLAEVDILVITLVFVVVVVASLLLYVRYMKRNTTKPDNSEV